MVRIDTQQHDVIPYFETNRASGGPPTPTRAVGKYPSTLVNFGSLWHPLPLLPKNMYLPLFLK